MIQLCYRLENETLMDILRLVLNRECESEEVDETLCDQTEVQIVQECMDNDHSDDSAVLSIVFRSRQNADDFAQQMNECVQSFLSD